MNAVRIRTRYIGPTDTKGSRIRATGGGHSLTVSYDYSASNAHDPAAEGLARVLGAAGVLQVGHHDRGYIYETVDLHAPDCILCAEDDAQDHDYSPRP